MLGFDYHFAGLILKASRKFRHHNIPRPGNEQKDIEFNYSHKIWENVFCHKYIAILIRKNIKNENYIVQDLAIKKRHQAYRIAAIVQNAPMKPKSWFFESQSFTRGGPA